MIPLRFPTLSLAAILSAWIGLAACGGKVVVDGAGAPGGGGAGTTTTGPTTTTTNTLPPGVGGGAPGCDQLAKDLAAKLAAARACDPFIDADQCSGMLIVHDACGCEQVANDLSPAAAGAAEKAWDAFSSCGPLECFGCPPPPPWLWFCDPGTMKCQPTSPK